MVGVARDLLNSALQSVVTLSRFFSTKEIHFAHTFFSLSFCKLSECVIFSIRYMSSIVSVHSFTVGGSGSNQCLVIFFLAAVIIIINRCLLAFSIKNSDLPKMNVSKWYGIFV